MIKIKTLSIYPHEECFWYQPGLKVPFFFKFYIFFYFHIKLFERIHLKKVQNKMFFIHSNYKAKRLRNG